LGQEYKEKPKEAIIGRLTKYSQEKRNRDQQRATNGKSTSTNRETSKKNSQTH
jgi:hypothetical protein